MSDQAMWSVINDMRDRLARYEERAANRDARIAEINSEVDQVNGKLDKLLGLVQQADGARKMALVFGKWGYGLTGAVGAALLANWQSIKRFF